MFMVNLVNYFFLDFSKVGLKHGTSMDGFQNGGYI